MPRKSAFLYRGKPYSFRQVALKYHRVRTRMPRMMGDEVVRFSRMRFRAQAWTDAFAKKWQKRKDPKGNGKGRAILVKSGRLRNSIRLMQANISKIVVGSSLPYAAAHNDGFKGSVQVRAHKRSTSARSSVQSIKTRRRSSVKVRTGTTTVKAHTRHVNLPQRQFLGNSAHLNKKLDRIIFREIDKIF